jgi:hypothetical protein
MFEGEFRYGVLVKRWEKSKVHRNRRKGWLKANPKGSTARIAWEAKHELNESLRQLLEREP